MSGQAVGLFLRRWALAGVVALAAGFGAPDGDLQREGDAWVETVSGTVAVNEPVEMRLDVRGSVVIRGDGGNQAAYRIRRRVEAASEQVARRRLAPGQLRVRRLGQVLQFDMQEDPSPGVSVEIEVRAPRALRYASVESRGGRLLLDGLACDIRAVTAGGPVEADRIAGSLAVRSGGGAVVLGQIGGEVTAFTGGGSIRLKRSGRDARLETVGGEIYIEEAGGAVNAVTGAGDVEVLRSLGEVTARTNGGLIRVHQAQGEVNAQNAGGGILVGSATGVRCEAMAGAVKLLKVHGELRAVTAAGSILAELLSGKPLADSYLATSRGDVVVVIPSNLAVTVEALNLSRLRPGGIVSEFEEVQVRGRDQVQGREMAGPRLVASGAINGGGPTLRISATEGTIFLRRQK